MDDIITPTREKNIDLTVLSSFISYFKEINNHLSNFNIVPLSALF